MVLSPITYQKNNKKQQDTSFGPSLHFLLLLLLPTLFFGGCASTPSGGKMMETTAYCGESGCGDWERGNPSYLHLDFWNRYQTKGRNAGKPYSGLTANGSVPREPQAGLFSSDSLERPYMIPVRLILFPWYMFPEDGTIAADTRYYPFGTRMYIPGYGWGTVSDRGGAIKGPERLDLYFESLEQAKQWGRKRLRVSIERP